MPIAKSIMRQPYRDVTLHWSQMSDELLTPGFSQWIYLSPVRGFREWHRTWTPARSQVPENLVWPARQTRLCIYMNGSSRTSSALRQL